MAPVWRLTVITIVSMSAITIALPNHTPNAPGVVHRRAPNYTPDAPKILQRRAPDHTPSAPGVLHVAQSSKVPVAARLVPRQATTITAAAPTITGTTPSATPAMQIEQLVAGIGFNIMAQKAQIAVVSIMQNLGNAPAVPDTNAMLYKVAKVVFVLSRLANIDSQQDDLLSFMSAGMRIRGNNMQLSGVNPQITRGLGQVSHCQSKV